MKALVDRLSAELSDRYVQYLETLMVDLWSEAGLIEFRVGYAPRRDHKLRSFTVKVEADAGETDREREVFITSMSTKSKTRSPLRLLRFRLMPIKDYQQGASNRLTLRKARPPQSWCSLTRTLRSVELYGLAGNHRAID